MKYARPGLRRSSRLSFLALCSIAALAGWMSGCDSSGPVDPVPLSIDDIQMQVVTGADQVGVAGERLPDPLVVRVVDRRGRGQKDQIVNFVVVAGGGTVFAGTSLTDSEGLAQEIWTLGPEVGVQRVEARAVDTQTGEARVFAAFEATAREPASPLELVADSVEFTALADTLRLEATGGADVGGIDWAGYAWSSRDPSVATVDDAGLVESRAPGRTWVVASDGSEADSARVVVRQLPASLQVTPDSVALEIDETIQLVASVLDGNGYPVEGVRVAWETADSAVAVVDESGLVTGTGPGDVVIRTRASGPAATQGQLRMAAGDELVAVAKVVVVPPIVEVSVGLSPSELTLTSLGETGQLAVSGLRADGQALTAADVQWTSTASEVATVDGSGAVTAVSRGQTLVVASRGDVADTATVTVDPVPAQVIVSAPAGSLESARSMQLDASVVDASGHEVEGAGVVWTSSDTERAVVSADGRVRGIAPGQVTITAASGEASGTSTVDVFDPPLPGTRFFSDDMESGSLGAWTDGVDPSRHTIVTDPSAARSGSRGLRVDYPSGGDGGWLTRFFTTGYHAVHVRYWVRLAPGWRGGTSLVGVYGSRTDDRWSAFGKFGTCPTGTDFFNTLLQASGGDPGPVEFLTFHPDIGGSCQGSTGDAGTTYMDGRDLTPGEWHRVEIEVEANQPGSADGEQRMWIDGELKATWSGIRFRDSYVLMLNAAQLAFGSVAGAPADQHLFVDDVEISYLETQGGGDVVASVVVEPGAVSVEEGGTAQLSADVRNAEGVSLEGHEVSWSSSASGVAVVDGVGTVSAVGPGTATITATSDGVAGTASVTVTAVSPGSASVELGVTSLRLTSLGESRTVAVTAKDENGTALSASDLSWSSTDTGIASVDGAGSVTAVANGEARIVAAFGSAADTATVTVAQEVASLTVTPSSASLEVGQSVGLTAEALDARGVAVQGASTSWTSSDPGVATVDGTGRVTAVAAGSTTVTATSSGRSDASSIVVSEGDGGGGGGGGGNGWPNEPSGFVQITDQPWDALSSNGWGHLNRAAQSRVVADASAPHSPSGVLEHLYPEGFTSQGTEPAVDWINLGGASEIFLGFWWKPSNPWQGHSTGINKVLFAWDQQNAKNVVLTMRGSPGGPYYLEALPEGHPAQSAGYLTQNRSRIPVRLGEWQRVELRVSIPDGVIRWWVDGTLVGEYSGLDLSSGGFGELQIAPTWGGLGGSDKQQTDYFRYDHVFVSAPGS